MFGLMKQINCSDRGNPEERRNYRFYYCGVCKSIGTHYGHKMRLFLNHDAAFLARLLSQLSGENKNGGEWERAYFRSNCFVMPKEVSRVGEMAAAVNMLLAELNLEDKIQDAGPKREWPWKWLKRKTSVPGREAMQRLKEWRFPVGRISLLAKEQREREQEPCRSLEYYSEPTAIITGIVFQRAGMLANRDDDNKNDKKKENKKLYAMGFSFGRLAYILDALEDFKKDRRKGEFNAIAAAYGYPGSMPEPSPFHRERTVALLTDLRESVTRLLRDLPVTAEFADYYSRRLKGNLNRRLRLAGDTDVPSCHIPQKESSKWGHRRRFQLSAVGVPGGWFHRLRHNKVLNGLMFMLALPFMFGLRFLDFGAASNPAGTKKKSGCFDACDCCCDCGDCCTCCGDGGDCDCGCCDCDCGCCDCDCGC